MRRPSTAVGSNSRHLLDEGYHLKLHERSEDSPDRQFVINCAGEGDLGCVRLLHRLYEGSYVYDQGSANWFRWNGHFWARDITGEFVREFQERLECAFFPHAREHHMVQEALQRVWSQPGIRRIIALSEDGGWFGISGEDWDRDPTLLAVKNGVIDLVQGKLRVGDPEDYIRTAAPVAYRSNAKRTRWLQFLREIFHDPKDPERADAMSRYLQVSLGRALLGPRYGAAVIVLYGPNGRNGKDELVHALQAALGDRLAKTIDNALLVGRKGGSAEDASVIALQGVRIAIASETDARDQFAEAQVKKLSGGGQLSARAPYAKARISFNPTHTLVLLTNHLPKYRDGAAMRDRLHLIEFRNRFLEDPTPGSEYEFKADPNVRAELAAEAEGIFAWLVEGAILFLRDGLQRPDEVKRALNEYEAEADPMGSFLRERTEQSRDGILHRDELVDEFLAWRAEDAADPEELKRLRAEMTAAAQKLPWATVIRRKSHGARIVEVEGIRWKS